MSKTTRIVTKDDANGIQVEYVLPTDLYDKIVDKVNSYMNKYVGWRKMFVVPGEQAEDNIDEGKYGYIINAISAQSNLTNNCQFTENLPRVDALVVNYNNECLYSSNTNNLRNTNGLTNGKSIRPIWSPLPTTSTTSSFTQMNFSAPTLLKLTDFSLGLKYGYTIQLTVDFKNSATLPNTYSNMVYLALSGTEALSTSAQDFHVKLGNSVSYQPSGSGTDYKYQVNVNNFGGTNVLVSEMLVARGKLNLILSVSDEKAILYYNGTKLSETTNIENLRTIKSFTFNKNDGYSGSSFIHCFRVWNTALDELDIESVYELNETY